MRLYANTPGREVYEKDEYLEKKKHNVKYSYENSETRYFQHTISCFSQFY